MPGIAYSWQLPPGNNLHTDQSGKLTPAAYGIQRALYNRTGGGTGIVNKVNPTVSAGGNSQATAPELTHDWHVVTDGAGGVRLQSLKPGQDVDITNNTGAPINIYPFSNGQINALAANAPYSLPNGKAVTMKTLTTIGADGSPAQLKSFLSD
jgi:hypothetical protein